MSSNLWIFSGALRSSNVTNASVHLRGDKFTTLFDNPHRQRLDYADKFCYLFFLFFSLSPFIPRFYQLPLPCTVSIG